MQKNELLDNYTQLVKFHSPKNLKNRRQIAFDDFSYNFESSSHSDINKNNKYIPKKNNMQEYSEIDEFPMEETSYK